MKLFVISDLHAGFAENNAFNKGFSWHKEDVILEEFSFLKDVDVLCACGDIDEGLMGAIWLLKVLNCFPHLHAVYVPGNHEFYNHQMEALYRDWDRLSSTNPRLHILGTPSTTKCKIEYVTFIGTTMWTDFNKQNMNVMNEAQRRMNDYRCIMSGEHSKTLTANRVLNEHFNARKRIFRELDREGNTPTVVLTHHTPYLARPYMKDTLSYAYHVDLTEEFNNCQHLPVYWFSGHTHKSECFAETFANGAVTFVSNQYGYPTEGATGFSKYCILEI